MDIPVSTPYTTPGKELPTSSPGAHRSGFQRPSEGPQSLGAHVRARINRSDSECNVVVAKASVIADAALPGVADGGDQQGSVEVPQQLDARIGIRVVTAFSEGSFDDQPRTGGPLGAGL